MGLSLGNIEFADFEVPAVVAFGGRQSLAVYRLPGGVRVVDALGPDDWDIAWQGVLSGGTATDRARALDAIRISGQPVSLTWDEFAYSVVIAELRLSYCNNWWIVYQINCLVVVDPETEASPQQMQILGAVASDLGSAATFMDVSLAADAVSSAGSAAAGTAAYAAAQLALITTEQNIASAIQASSSAMTAGASVMSVTNLAATVNASGTLAAATAARGYVARAAANYGQVTF
jgi:hypothetical protein